MENITAALVGGLLDADGVAAFTRPVLFGTAGDVVLHALPEAVGTRYFAHAAGEAALAGTQDLPLAENRFASRAGMCSSSPRRSPSRRTTRFPICSKATRRRATA